MKSFKKVLLMVALLSVCGTSALAQEKHFDNKGLSFEFPGNWVLQDQSNAEAQQLNLTRPGSDSQIRVFAYATSVDTPEKVAEAKRVLVDSYINSTDKQLQEMGARTERVPASIEFGGIKADGVKIQASLGGEPGAAEIYHGVIGQRLVVLTFFGPDEARRKAESGWELIRSSLKVEAPKPAATKN
jgi:hypothetical protein